MTVVADTGALYALVDASDKWHEGTVQWWSRHGREVVVPMVVLPEVTYLLHTRIGVAAERAFVAAVVAGEFVVESPDHDDVPRSLEVMEDYLDLSLGFVDCMLVATAERLGARELLTTDRKHFSIVKPRHARNFTLHP